MYAIDSTSIIIDTDIGFDIDDAYALAMAIKGGLQIGGISTVSGNTLKRGRIAKKMLVLAGKGDVPVFAGKRSRALLTHDRWVSPSEILDVQQDVDAMIEHYWHAIERSHDGRLQVVAIGPLSNIALVRERDGNLFDDRVQLLMMGGRFPKGLLWINDHMLEYNIMMDRAAARAVLGSRVPTRLVPFDVTESLKLTQQDLAFLHRISKHDSMIRALMEMTSMFHSSIIGHRPPILFDPATIVPLLDPTILSFMSMSVEVTRGGFTRVPKTSKPGVSEKEVCTAIDTGRFYDLFFTTLTGKPRHHRRV